MPAVARLFERRGSVELNRATIHRPPIRHAEAGLMYYAYILRSESFPNQIYVGSTGDLRRRLAEHNAGKSTHTSKFKPWELMIYVAFQEQRSAETFERYLKSGSGRAFARRHLAKRNSVLRRMANPSTPTEGQAYLLRVPHSLRGWQRVRVLTFLVESTRSNFRLGSISGVHALFSPY